MSDAAVPLPSGAPATSGVLTAADLSAMADAGQITAAQPLEAGQIQPASIDLRLGPVAYRVRSSFLPLEGRSVRVVVGGGMARFYEATL